MIDTDEYEELLENVPLYRVVILRGMQHRDLWELASELLAEVKRLREDIEGYKAIWNYLDPKGYAWEEEAFVALLKEHGFETGEEE